MLNQKRKRKERVREIKAEKRLEEVMVEVEKILERLGQIEVEETWMKTWRTRREQKR